MHLTMAALLALAGWLAVPHDVREQPEVNPQAAALADLTRRAQEYLKLRESLEKKLDPLAPNASAVELKSRQEALTKSLRAARAGAQQGDLVPPAVQEQIRATIRADFARREPAARRAALEEVPGGVPAINAVYPKQAALASVPPLLLASLPRLPDNLQYRFLGRHVLVIDGDLEIVIDFVRDALPR